jgi:hypothetical protein
MDASSIYRDALLAARDYSADALLAFADGFAATVADTDAALPGEVGRHLARERLRAVRAELERRERLSRIAAGVPSPTDRRYQAWRDLARLVRERADMLRVFDLCDHHWRRTGRHEAHAACPVCPGGADRLVITAGPPDLCWCRKCGWGGDVVTATMALRQATFRDAVAWLAGLCGESTTDGSHTISAAA